MVTALSGDPGHTPNRMSYDLRRMRQKEPIGRVPDTNAYRITDSGQRLAVFTPRSTTDCSDH